MSGNLKFLPLSDCKIFHHDEAHEYAKAGITLLLLNNFHVTQHIKLSAEPYFKGSINLYITNIYKECDIVLTDQMMNAIGNFDDGHSLLVDLNSQNFIWGIQNLSPSETLWENFANASGVVIRNDGFHTILNMRNTLTAIAVLMTSSDFAPCLSWTALSTPETGDHFPIKISNNKQI